MLQPAEEVAAQRLGIGVTKRLYSAPDLTFWSFVSAYNTSLDLRPAMFKFIFLVVLLSILVTCRSDVRSSPSQSAASVSSPSKGFSAALPANHTTFPLLGTTSGIATVPHLSEAVPKIPSSSPVALSSSRRLPLSSTASNAPFNVTNSTVQSRGTGRHPRPSIPSLTGMSHPTITLRPSRAAHSNTTMTKRPTVPVGAGSRASSSSPSVPDTTSLVPSSALNSPLTSSSSHIRKTSSESKLLTSSLRSETSDGGDAGHTTAFTTTTSALASHSPTSSASSTDNAPYVQKLVTFDDTTYALPISGTVLIPLLHPSGVSSLLLGPSMVAIGDAHFTVPLAGQSTTLTSAGKTISVGSRSPQSKGHHCMGLGCLFNAAKGLSKAAGDVAKAAASAESTAKGWFSGSIKEDAAQFAGQLQGVIKGASSSADTLANGLSDALAGSGIELSELDSTGQEVTSTASRRIFDAYPQTSIAQNWISTMKNLAKGLTSTSPEIASQATDLLRSFFLQGSPATASGALAGSTLFILGALNTKSLHDFAAFDWDSAQPNIPIITSTNTSSTIQSPTKAAPETVSPSPSVVRSPYGFVTKFGTSNDTFDSFLSKHLWDAGKSGARSYFRDSQGYNVDLTEEESEYVQSQDFVACCAPLVEFDVDDVFFGSVTATNVTGARRKRDDTPVEDDPILLERDPSEGHLRFVSQAPNVPITTPYRFDKSNGYGATIFVLDSGFNVQHNELQNRRGGAPTVRVIGNSAILKDPTGALPETIDDWRGNRITLDNGDTFCEGHGTQMASIAGGSTLGVASDSRLYLIKVVADFVNPDYPGDGGCERKAKVNWRGFDAGMRHVLDLVRSDPGQYQKRSVLSMSWGLPVNQMSRRDRNQIKDNFNDLENEGVTVVVTSGNEGLQKIDSGTTTPGYLNEILPQAFERPQNSLVVVGGVDNNGALDLVTTPRGQSRASTTIYAPSRNVRVAGNNPNDPGWTKLAHGTSFSAPAVAGVLAQWFTIAAVNSAEEDWPRNIDASLPQWSFTDLSPRDFVRTAKRLLVAFTWQRTSNFAPVPPGYTYRYTPPTNWPSVYNGVYHFMRCMTIPGASDESPDLRRRATATANLATNMMSATDITVAINGTWIASTPPGLKLTACPVPSSFKRSKAPSTRRSRTQTASSTTSVSKSTSSRTSTRRSRAQTTSSTTSVSMSTSSRTSSRRSRAQTASSRTSVSKSTSPRTSASSANIAGVLASLIPAALQSKTKSEEVNGLLSVIPSLRKSSSSSPPSATNPASTEAPPPHGEGTDAAHAPNPNWLRLHLRQWVGKNGNWHIVWWAYTYQSSLIAGPQYGTTLSFPILLSTMKNTGAQDAKDNLYVNVQNPTDRWSTTIKIGSHRNTVADNVFGDNELVTGADNWTRSTCGSIGGTRDLRESWYQNPDGTWQRDFDCYFFKSCSLTEEGCDGGGVFNQRITPLQTISAHLQQVFSLHPCVTHA
ncbi:hypothetical protein NA57DRAFT_60980 [Rhizodiscina lignyota]|uniref:Peptidase S8/S53 domain-containing protein n=1 Tax=Rhizodiscina lignyota TaxID=1504668 RepID=A0A9P4M0M5_9PEZI|nr:hypothetical protein NA57DRAFT_60980 [Rhizodiscina lignyota]